MALPTQQQPSAHTPCPSVQPVDAFNAWKSVFDFRPGVAQQSYLQSWQQTHAFQGLNRARPPVGMPRMTDPHVKLPSSIKDQDSIQEALRQIPTVEEANSRACVRLHGGGPGWDQKMQKEFNDMGKCPGRFQDCYSVDADGSLTKAESLAEKAYKKEHAPKVQPGYCLSSIDAMKSNAKSKASFAHKGDTIQRLSDYIAVLEAEILRLQNQTGDSCTM